LHEHRLHLSAVSIWEIGLLFAKQRIALSAPVRDWVRAATALPGLRLRPLDVGAALESAPLPGEPHADPANRLPIAEARTGRLTLLTADSKTIEYGQTGYVQMMMA
jgi:PIN domain nuclease of toxin-antitoxin system